MSVGEFEELVEPHLGGLYGFAYKRTKKQEDAEDLVQDTLLKAWDRIDSLSDHAKVRSWLFTILMNMFLARTRTSARRNQLVPITDIEDDFDAYVASPIPSPLEEVVRRSAAQAVHAALAKVPDRYALAVELRDLEGLSYKEISSVLDVPVGTIMSRIARGRKKMAALLAEWREQPPERRERATR